MAYYFIFPEKDTTIYSHPNRKNMNAGGDEILELLKERGTTTPHNYPSRILMKFKTSEIENIIGIINKTSDVFNDNETTVSLQLTAIQEQSLVETNVLSVYAISQSWNEGTGRYLNHPTSSNGATWDSRDNSVAGTSWETTGFAAYTTGSIVSASTLTPGGGVWYTGSNFTATQQFLTGESLDTDIDVTEITRKWSSSIFSNSNYPEGIENNGIIIKTPDSVESNSAYSFGELSYFSNNTHTIYPPKLVFKWDDSANKTNLYDTNLSVISGSINIDLYNNKKEYNQNDEALFRFHVRDKYPTRTFSTTSNYLHNLRLKSGISSLYSIRDAYTEQVIIPFDDNFTQLSHDGESSYFKFYMNGLQPERYYRILIKQSNLDGVVIYDNKYYFKVVR